MNDHVARSAQAQLTRIARGGTLNLVGAAISAASGLVLVVIVANLVDQQTAGQFFSATSAFLILLGVCTLGTDSGLARFVLRFQEHSRSADIVTCIRVARRPVVVLSVITAVVVVAVADPLAELIGLSDEDGATTVRLLALLLPAAALNDVSLGGTRAFGWMRTTVAVDRIMRPGAQPLGALLVAVSGGGVLALSLAWSVPYVVAAIVSAYLLHRMLVRRGLDRSRSERSVRRAVGREFWVFTWPRSIARVFQIILQRADIVLIAALLSPRDAAVYTAATRFVVLGQFAANAIQQVLQPRLSQMLARGDDEVAERVLQTSTAWTIALAWPIHSIVGGGAAIYLSFFGPGYSGAAAQLVVLTMAAAMMVAVAAGPVDTMLLMGGRSTTSLANSGAALVTNIVLCLVLIPRVGIVGPAIAWAAAVVLRNGLATWQVRRGLGMSTWSRPAVRVAMANLLCLALPLLTVGLLTEGAPLMALTLVAGLAAYAALLWRWRIPLSLDLALTALLRRSGAPALVPPTVPAASE